MSGFLDVVKDWAPSVAGMVGLAAATAIPVLAPAAPWISGAAAGLVGGLVASHEGQHWYEATATGLVDAVTDGFAARSKPLVKALKKPLLNALKKSPVKTLKPLALRSVKTGVLTEMANSLMLKLPAGSTPGASKVPTPDSIPTVNISTPSLAARHEVG
ncbi:hypothetical protein [Nocardia tengchongensis]|uniref:hypothetical protein n=1 Tax=Nocardia tengchongensis TaxID=2055889 RepID=UPI00361F8050